MKPHWNDVSVVFSRRQSWDHQEIGKRIAWLNIMKMRDYLWWCRARLLWTTCRGGNLSDKLETVLTKAEDMHTVFQKDHSYYAPNKKMCACLTIQPCQKRLSILETPKFLLKWINCCKLVKWERKSTKLGVEELGWIGERISSKYIVEKSK